MATHLTEDQRTAMTEATSAAAALRVRVDAGGAGGDGGAGQAVVADALAAAGALVDAAPALAERHRDWLVRFEVTRRYRDQRRALAAVNHLSSLSQALRRPVIVADPGVRFAGDFDEVVVTPQ